MEFKVLLFEDHPIWQKRIADAIKTGLQNSATNVSVIAKSTIRSALEEFQAHDNWDLLVSDLDDELEIPILIEELLEVAEKKGIPCIIVSGAPEFRITKGQIVKLVKKFGAFPYVDKIDFDREAFIKLLRRTIKGEKEMDISIAMPLILQATKFLFDELKEWLDNKEDSSKPLTIQSKEQFEKTMTLQGFESLSSKPVEDIISEINLHNATSYEYEISGLIEQIQIHKKNIVDMELQETQFGQLTPIHIKRGLEQEHLKIREKSIRLKHLLEQIYARVIVVNS